MIFMIQKFKIEYDWTTAQQPMVFLTNKKRSYRFGIEPATLELCGSSFIELKFYSHI